MHKWENVTGSISSDVIEDADGNPLRVRRFHIAVQHGDEIFFADAGAPLAEADAYPEQVNMLLDKMVEHIEANITAKELQHDRSDE